jgi:hypothetical protein
VNCGWSSLFITCPNHLLVYFFLWGKYTLFICNPDILETVWRGRFLLRF